jgi:hypothetical protein
MRRATPSWLVTQAAVIAILVPGGCKEGRKQAPPQTAPASTALDASAVTNNNRGVGLMGRFDFDGAAKLFDELARRYPEAWDVRVNLAIATLNRQGPGDEA